MAITFDSSFAEATSFSTHSYTVGTGSNRALVVFAGQQGTSTAVSTATYAGDSMSLLGTVNSEVGVTGRRITAFILATPDEGANDVVFDQACIILAASFFGVDQSTPNRTIDSNVATTGTSSQVDPTSETDDLVVDGILTREVTTVTAGENQDALATDTTSNFRISGSRKAGASGTTAMSWTMGTSDDHAHIGLALIPASTGHPARRRLGSVPFRGTSPSFTAGFRP